MEFKPSRPKRENRRMNIKTLYDEIPPWEWPGNAGEMLKEVLDDPSAVLSDRLIAAEMAGDLVVFDNDLAATLLIVVSNNDEPVELRKKAVISFGPAFEHVDLYEFDDPDDIVISEEVFHKLKKSLKHLFYDASVPEEVRRSILEAVVRAPEDWHTAAVRAAFGSSDEPWQLTAIFCMRFLEGFDPQILKSLKSNNPNIRYHAIAAAGNWELQEAWPSIQGLFSDPDIDKRMLFAAIDAAAGIATPEAISALSRCLTSDDDDIVEAAEEALTMLSLDVHDDEDYEMD